MILFKGEKNGDKGREMPLWKKHVEDEYLSMKKRVAVCRARVCVCTIKQLRDCSQLTKIITVDGCDKTLKTAAQVILELLALNLRLHTTITSIMRNRNVMT